MFFLLIFFIVGKNNDEKNAHEDPLFTEEEDGKGDEFMAVKPWLGALKEPTGYKNPKGQNKAPDVDIELNYVFGYRTKSIFF